MESCCPFSPGLEPRSKTDHVWALVNYILHVRAYQRNESTGKTLGAEVDVAFTKRGSRGGRSSSACPQESRPSSKAGLIYMRPYLRLFFSSCQSPGRSQATLRTTREVSRLIRQLVPCHAYSLLASSTLVLVASQPDQHNNHMSQQKRDRKSVV